MQRGPWPGPGPPVLLWPTGSATLYINLLYSFYYVKILVPGGLRLGNSGQQREKLVREVCYQHVACRVGLRPVPFCSVFVGVWSEGQAEQNTVCFLLGARSKKDFFGAGHFPELRRPPNTHRGPTFF